MLSEILGEKASGFLNRRLLQCLEPNFDSTTTDNDIGDGEMMERTNDRKVRHIGRAHGAT